jgi:hypothetical protein
MSSQHIKTQVNKPILIIFSEQDYLHKKLVLETPKHLFSNPSTGVGQFSAEAHPRIIKIGHSSIADTEILSYPYVLGPP